MFTLALTLPYQSPYFIQTNCSTLLYKLQLKYGDYLTATSSICPTNNILIVIRITDFAYKLHYRSQHFITEYPLLTIENLLNDHRTFFPNIFALHGAAVAQNGQAYLFLAATNSGKTTLTCHLVHNGFNYITDDCILLDRETFHVYPYATPLHLRSNSLKILAHYSSLPETIISLEEISFQRYVYVPRNYITTSLPIGRIFFITYSAKENLLVEMSGNERMAALLKSPIKEYPLNKNYLHFIARLSQFPCNNLLYKDMNYVKEILQYG